MKLGEMIERVQQHHPNMGITEIVRTLNDSVNDMGFRAEVIEALDQFPLVENQRVYKLSDYIIKLKAVDYDNKSISKLIGRPKERDLY